MSTHDHDFPAPENYVDPNGREGVDIALLSRFMGAAFDACTTCQDAELTLIVSDPPTCARLVELACTDMAAQFGGLPASVLNPSAPSVLSREFRELAQAGVDGNNDALHAACAAMKPTQRRKAANDAADRLVASISLRAFGNLDGG